MGAQLERGLNIDGGTDGTTIGNVGDRMKADVVVSSLSGGLVLTLSKKLRYVDMNASSGGVARGTNIVNAAAATTVFSYSGSGSVGGFMVNLEGAGSASHNWQINLIIDGEEIFETGGIHSPDLVATTIYNLNSAGAREPATLGLEMSDTAIYFATSNFYPIKYETSVVVKVTKVSGGDRAFNAGLVILTKET